MILKKKKYKKTLKYYTLNYLADKLNIYPPKVLLYLLDSILVHPDKVKPSRRKNDKNH